VAPAEGEREREEEGVVRRQRKHMRWVLIPWMQRGLICCYDNIMLRNDRPKCCSTKTFCQIIAVVEKRRKSLVNPMV